MKKRTEKEKQGRRLEHQRRNYRENLKRFGLSPFDYQSLLEAQQGKCAICDRLMMPIYFDHDHQTGVLRGLLCRTCNMALGLLQDNPKWFKTALKYLGY